MNLALTLISLLFLFHFLFKKHLASKRTACREEMKSVYARMEMVFVKNHIILSNRYIELLKVYKNLYINPDYLDVQILSLIKKEAQSQGVLEKNIRWHNSVLDSLPKEFKELDREYEAIAERVIYLSLFKWDFVAFFIRRILFILIKEGISDLVEKIKKEKDAILENEFALSRFGLKATPC